MTQWKFKDRFNQHKHTFKNKSKSNLHLHTHGINNNADIKWNIISAPFINLTRIVTFI